MIPTTSALQRPDPPRQGRRQHLAWPAVALAMAAALSAVAPTAGAHDFRAGKLQIDHPYALPTSAGVTNGAVYFRGIRNRGDEPDRLIGGSTDRAGRVEIHETVMDGDIARMREVDAIALPAQSKTPLRHGQRYHLMLVDLKQPLVDGERFDLTLRFERNGVTTVKVWVQRPGGRAAEAAPTSNQAGHGHHH